jgi:hypothetical protein
MKLAFEYFNQYLEEAMSTINKPSLRWGLLSLHLGVIIFMMACMVFTGVQQSDNGLFQFDDGNIEVQNENGDCAADGTSFELVGILKPLIPTVAGIAFETRDQQWSMKAWKPAI